MKITSKTPQLAKSGDPDLIPGALMEPKYDGHRILAHVDGLGNVRLYARTGADKSGHCPNIEDALRILPPNTVVDGEICKLTTEGNDWSAVQTVLGSSSKVTNDLTYVVFDVLELGGYDVRDQGLIWRRGLAEAVVAACASDAVQLTPQVPYSAEAVQALIEAGWEGAIVKDPRAKYASGQRGKGWVKIKAVDTVDVIVTGTTAGQGKYAGLLGALTFGLVGPDGQLVEVGRCSGMTDAERERFTALHAEGKLVGTVIEIAHMGKLASGSYRHPQFKRVRTDKTPDECLA